jgi:creatine kinase
MILNYKTWNGKKLLISFLGAKNLNSHVGVYACDPEGYETFKDLLDAVICDYHKVPKVAHPKADFGPQDNLGLDPLDTAGEFILSTRIRVGRSHEGFPFPPVATDEVSTVTTIPETFHSPNMPLLVMQRYTVHRDI